MRRSLQPLGVLAVLAFALFACQTSVDLPLRFGEGAPDTTEPAQASAGGGGKAVQAPDLVALEDTLVDIYEQANRGVVALRLPDRDGGSQGSGFVFDQEGHVVTNYHVVEAASELEVAFASGFKTRGRVIGTDLDSDLAVLEVQAPPEELHPLRMGDSDQVKVGQAVIAIGNPFQFYGTMTMGIVSGIGRTMDSLHEAPDGGNFTAGDIIQTDAAINPGNSGGPLLNLNGEVIGVNRAIFTTSFSNSGQPLSSGLGFAISSNIIRRVVPSLISDGKYDYPYVGISSISEFSLEDQEALGLTRSTGVYVLRVIPGGPADEAGLQGAGLAAETPGLESGGDLIIAVDGVEVLTYSDFISYLIKNKSPDDRVVLTVLREGTEIQVELTLGRRPEP